MPAPVTVSVTRHVDPSHSTEMRAWVQAGTALAEQFDGFLGSGWVRPAPDSTDWHMIYRFADERSLQRWEESPQRAWWLEAAAGTVELKHVERRTGIEGWFDHPAEVTAAAAPPAPPRWKQMITIFIVFFPLSIVANSVALELLGGWPLVLRVLATVVVMTPLMTYVFLPWITRTLSGWLHR